MSTGSATAGTCFTAGGWTAAQFAATHEFFYSSTEPGANAMASWMRRYPCQGVDERAPIGPVTPTMVMDVFARHGVRSAQILTAMSAGASERFVMAFLGPRWVVSDFASAGTAWQFAIEELGLNEAQAAGWAATDCLHTPRDKPVGPWVPVPSRARRTLLTRSWIRRFGPTSYLHVLAGFTLEEATELQQAGTAIDEQQLRVMAVLNGHILPAGL